MEKEALIERRVRNLKGSGEMTDITELSNFMKCESVKVSDMTFIEHGFSSI